jgi:hypothetical protein
MRGLGLKSSIQSNGKGHARRRPRPEAASLHIVGLSEAAVSWQSDTKPRPRNRAVDDAAEIAAISEATRHYLGVART